MYSAAHFAKGHQLAMWWLLGSDDVEDIVEAVQVASDLYLTTWASAPNDIADQLENGAACAWIAARIVEAIFAVSQCEANVRLTLPPAFVRRYEVAVERMWAAAVVRRDMTPASEFVEHWTEVCDAWLDDAVAEAEAAAKVEPKQRRRLWRR